MQPTTYRNYVVSRPSLSPSSPPPPQLFAASFPLVSLLASRACRAVPASQIGQDGENLFEGLNGGGLYNEGRVSFFENTDFIDNHGLVSAESVPRGKAALVVAGWPRGKAALVVAGWPLKGHNKICRSRTLCAFSSRGRTVFLLRLDSPRRQNFERFHVLCRFFFLIAQEFFAKIPFFTSSLSICPPPPPVLPLVHQRGGALHNAASGVVKFLKGAEASFSESFAAGRGGQVYNEGSLVFRDMAAFSEGYSGGSGGAIYSEGTMQFFKHVDFVDNVADAHGGAIASSYDLIDYLPEDVTYSGNSRTEVSR